MISQKKVVVLLLSLLLVLTGCVFKEGKQENIILQVASSNESRAVTLKQANYTQEYETVEEQIIGSSLEGIEYREAADSNGVAWLAAKVQDATDAVREVKLIHTYNQFNEKISTIEVPGTESISDATGVVYQYGQYPQVGAEWNPTRVTRYGYDCAGCSITDEDFSGTASGIKLSGNSVRQSNGEWQSGLTYDGMYVIATSTSIPICTVVEISDHPFSGAGITPGVPFTAIVGDRGVGGSNIDLFSGTEKNLNVISQYGNPGASNTKVKIVGFKGVVRNNGCR